MTEKSEEVEVLLKNRTSLRGKVTKLTNDFKEYRAGEVDQNDLAYKIHVLEQLEQKMISLQDVLSSKGVSDETPHLDNLREEVFKARRHLSR